MPVIKGIGGAVLPALGSALQAKQSGMGPWGAAGAALGNAAPRLFSTASDAFNAARSPTGPRNAQEIMGELGGLGVGAARQFLQSDFARGQGAALGGAADQFFQNIGRGQSWRGAYSQSGLHGFGGNFARAAESMLVNKAGGQGVNVHSGMPMGNPVLRQMLGAIPKGSPFFHLSRGMMGGYSRALSGQVMGAQAGMFGGGGGMGGGAGGQMVPYGGGGGGMIEGGGGGADTTMPFAAGGPPMINLARQHGGHGFARAGVV